MRFALPRWDRHGYLFALMCVMLATAVFLPARALFAKGQWALLYLLIVTLVASLCGVRAALLAASLSFLAWNFFLIRPYYSLNVHDPEDWLSLLVFLLVGMAMGLQTGRMREREAEALAREKETSLLNRLSASLVSTISTHTMAEAVLNEIVSTTGARGAAVWLADAGGHLNAPIISAAWADHPDAPGTTFAHWVFQQNKAVGLPPITSLAKLGVEGWPISAPHSAVMPCADCHDVYLPLQTATRIEGVLAIEGRRDGQPYTALDARLLVSITNLAASFLERQRLETAASSAEALHEAERLKNTLISSVSHELKTPLAAITATVTSLLENDVAWDPAVARDELTAVGEDLSRLNDSITALLDLSRLKADAWKPARDWYEVGEILGTAVSTFTSAERARIRFAIPDDLPLINVDFQQWARALQHLLENALAYAPAQTPVTVGAGSLPHEVRMWIEDNGPGIPAGERERIFEQFYRGSTADHVPSGTGLGLAIAAEIVRYHGGRLWVEDVHPHGARFVIAMPREAGEGVTDEQ